MKMTMVGAINDALRVEMKKDSSVILLGEDIGVDGGVFRVTDGLLKEFGEKRVFDTPLAESAIIGTSIGLSLNGFRPVAEIQFSGFLYPGFDQLISHASRIRNRSNGSFSCPIVVRMPYGGGIRALEHHGESMEALFAHTPGLKVIIPSNPYDAKGLLISAIRDPDPVIFMEPKKYYRSIKEEVPEGEYEVPIGKAKLVRTGSDVTIVSWGSMVHTALETAKKASAEGINCEVIDLRTIKPMDEEAILSSVKKTGRCVILHEGPRNCGVGAEISARLAEKSILDLKGPIVRVTGYDVPFPYFKSEDYYLPSLERLMKGINKVMKF